ncbi:uncharacterized protein LOC109540602 isoform X2 [Dendroctonus ponderosae]|uniref:uncharacterized protein LOC109540602 isoform X2 n=1 Tax=Dendroctonus ponderosae TaxID=77166 RepID=UPI00203534BF|nr:uncharacterized protein LOC109540602 isoform X2 [Dendroctonus ponderosae]
MISTIDVRSAQNEKKCFSKPKALRHQSKAVNIANVRATFRCEFCCFATTTSFLLMKHKSSHFSRIQNGLVECSHCDLTFFTMAECKKHMNEQSDLYETKSIEENIPLMTSSSDNEKWSSSHIIHNNSSELNGSLYSCWCGMFQSASRSQYLHHLKRIHSINFDSFEEINENDEATEETKTENGEETEEFGCPMPDCSFQADNEDDLELHLTQHRELNDDHIEIGVIRDERKQSKTRKPNETIQTTDQQQTSGWVPSDMEMLEDLQKQVKFIEVYAANDEDDSDPTETDEVIEKSESFVCEWCAYETTDNLHLDFHNRLMHNSNNVYICPQTDCLFQSKNQSSFKVHLLVTHQFSDIGKNPVNGSLIAHQLNGIKTEQSNPINIDPKISEDIQAVEDDIAQYTNIDTDESETIRIEIVEDQADNTTAEDSLKNNVKKPSLLIKCLNKGCDYYSRYDSDSIRKHINICSKKPKSFEDTPKSELCEQEKKHCPINKQESSSDAILSKSDQNMLLQQADLSKPENVTYKCLMCNTVISHRYTLKNHAHIHAREESHFDLIVGFSQFKGDVELDTIKIKCESNFIPRESSNVPIYQNAGKALNIGPPLLGYDPNLPVFTCTECNFKTNDTDMLDKHKSLHWNAEKDAAYAAKQWYTCEVCFYYCFDAVRFKQHEEIHKKKSSFH